MTSSLLEQILEANRSYLAGSPRTLEAGDPPFVVVSCVDARLTGLLEQAMGLPRHRAIVVRTAGNRVAAEHHDALRSIVAAVFVKGATEVFVVGHTDCAMAAFQSAQVVESFRSAGIPRSAFGDLDLRSWFGAIGSVRDNVAESVSFLRSCPLLPRGFPVCGLIIDTESGRLERMQETNVSSVSSQSSVTGAPPVQPEKDHTPAAPPSVPPPPPVQPPAYVAPTAAAAPAATAVKPPENLIDAARVLAAVIQSERGNPHFQQELLELRTALHGERNPLKLIALLERMASRYQTRHPELPPVIALLKRVLTSREAREKDRNDLISQFQRILR
jgi:carbonic anhydrase